MARARLLDLTRSLRRAGRGVTGVDRVELAYLEHFLANEAPVFGVIRTAFGYVILDSQGLGKFFNNLQGANSWGAASVLSRLARGRSASVKRAESDVRRWSIARSVRSRLAQMLQKTLPDGFDYYNVGHSNLTDRMMRGVKAVGGDIHVLIHDVIPLEYPDFQRPGTVAPFRAKLGRVSAYADRVIFNSQDTRRRAEQYMREFGQVPPSIVAYLGTIDPRPDPVDLPADLPPEKPYFVTVGTIEPRKNHAFLLDIWDELGDTAPPLLICGSRGWNNEAVFARLDSLSDKNPVRECSGLGDGALAALVQNSAGALFPSFAEGYGLPPIEAISLGARVLCNDLPVLHEILGVNASFAPVSERQLWLNKIREWEKTLPEVGDQEPFIRPKWHDHFKTVLRLT